MSLGNLRKHIESLQPDTFDPTLYKKRGYALRGSIRTDGFRLQLLAFKLKELQSVRYKRLSRDVLPLQINSTVGGVDYYLTEVRNVVKERQDVTNLWGCEPEQIKILGIDLGQACVVGASAVLPKDNQHIGAVRSQGSNAVTYYNLAVKQKAVYQPTFKHRRWIQEQKAIAPDASTESISEIESNLPPLCGEGVDFKAYVQGLEEAKKRMDCFYN
ncbi:hypothetical protein BGX21_007296, partial [Mortierella sp. AD011]